MTVRSRLPFSAFTAAVRRQHGLSNRRLTLLVGAGGHRHHATVASSQGANADCDVTSAPLPSNSTSTASVAAAPRGSLRQRALEVGLIASSVERAHPTLSAKMHTTRDRRTRVGESSPKVPHGRVTGSESPLEEFNEPSDPLLDFLEKNEEDAAALLAMWTSVTRACLYASELSESLTLRVRYFLHRLVHQKAIGAAWELYERLVYLGVQLRHSDIALLLTNLPYEHSADDRRNLNTWMDEDAAAQKERRTRARRQQEVAEETARWRRRAEAAASAPTDVTQAKAAPSSSAAVSDSVNSSDPSVDSTPTAKPVGTALEIHVLANQPEWVKRWLLYEASMGNFNLYEGTDGLAPRPAGDSDTSGKTTESAAPAAWDDSSVDGLSPQDMRDGAQQALRTMELVAHIEHCRILQLAPPATQRTSRAVAGQSVTPYRWRVRTAPKPRKDAEVLWREALNRTKRFYTAERLTSMPPELRDGLRAIVLGSQSWEAAMMYSQILTTCSVPLEPTDAVVFLHLSVDSRPWKSKTQVEAFTQERMLPLLARSSACLRDAALVMWLSHLCGVKSTRPEDFVVLLDDAARVFALSEASLRHGEVSALLRLVADAAPAAVRAFHADVHAFRDRQNAEHALAASIRTGSFSVPSSSGNHGAVTAATLRSASHDPLTVQTLVVENAHSCLSSALVSTFRTLTTCVQEALWLLALAASPRQKTSVEMLHQLLESCVYGPQSLWAVYDQLYGPLSRVNNSREHEAAHVAPERPYVALLMARFLTGVLAVVCRQYSRTRAGFGAKQTVPITSPGQVALLLELTERALGQAHPRTGGDETDLVRSSQLHSEAAKLCGEWPRVLRQLFTFLGVTSAHDERLLFGAVTPVTTECLARAGRLTLAVTTLAQRSAVPSATGLTTSPHAMWCAVPFRTRTTLRACFDRQTALGRKVRQHMNRKELSQLEALLFPVRRKGQVQGTFRYYAPLPRQLESSGYSTEGDAVHTAPGSTPRSVSTVLGASELDSLLRLREQALETVLRLGGDAAELNRVLSAHLAKTNWSEALQLLHILTEDLRVTHKTLHPRFFQCVLAAMTRTVPEPTYQRAERPPKRSIPRRGSPTASGVRESLWLNAIRVFWKAVDHTAPLSGVPHCAARGESQTSNASPDLNRHTHAEHERDVFEKLLVPMIEFSHAVGRADLGREWYAAWARLYGRREKRRPRFQHCSAEALSLLGDVGGLTQSAKLVQEESVTNPDEDHQDDARMEADAHDGTHPPALWHYADPLTEAQRLLCRVAPRQRQWLRALQTVSTAFGSLDAREAARLPYPPPAAAALLAVLARSPTNLSSTGLRLRKLQFAAAAEAPAEQTWDPPCAIALCEMLVKARRWKHAVSVVDEALTLPVMQAAKGGRLTGPTPTDAVCQYATLLTYGLQAAAIGGLGEKGTELYNAFQALESQLQDAGCAQSAEPTAVDQAVDEGTLAIRHHVEALSPRARSFFFRAVTKKMFPRNGEDADTAAATTEW